MLSSSYRMQLHAWASCTPPCTCLNVAIMCVHRIIKKVPDMMESFVERAASLLKANDGAVQLAGASLMLQVSMQAAHAARPVG